MEAAEKLITENLDVWTSTVKAKSSAGRGTSNKRELYGIQKLRELILELAVSGKLVPQVPDDEPAKSLIRRVKETLPNKKGANPFLRETGTQLDLESTYELPTGWEWLPLGHIGIWATGCGFPKKYQGVTEKEFLFCKVSDMNLAGNEIEIRTTANSIDADILAAIRGKVNPPGTVIFPKIGGAIATHKRRLICRPTLIDNNCSGIQPIGLTDNQWLLMLMQSLDLTKYQSGTSVPAVSQSSLDPIRVGIPPLAEQHRIVAKVDELMALCDQLEQEQESSLETHDTLVATLLGALTTATADASQLAQAWQRIQANFDTLFTTESSIDQLKQTILQLAVMGKLVPQNPEDEPAESLLKKIAVEWEKLIREKKIKKQKALPEISEKEIKKAIPSNWAHCRLNDLIQISSGDGLTAANMAENGQIPVYGGNGINGYHDKSNVSQKTLTIGRVGYYCGAVHVTPEKAWVTDNAFITTFPEEHIFIDFLEWLLKATDLKENENATAQPVISGRKLYPIVVGLPPLAEQHRIVAKVDELMALCDQLKASLATAQATQLNLADSLVEQAIG